MRKVIVKVQLSYASDSILIYNEDRSNYFQLTDPTEVTLIKEILGGEFKAYFEVPLDSAGLLLMDERIEVLDCDW